MLLNRGNCKTLRSVSSRHPQSLAGFRNLLIVGELRQSLLQSGAAYHSVDLQNQRFCKWLTSLKKIIEVYIAALPPLLYLVAAPMLFGQSDQGPAPILQRSQLNPEFVKWQEEQKERAARIAQGLPVELSEWRFGYIPSPFLPPVADRPLTQIEAMVKVGLAYYPPSFDLRTEGLVSEIRNQSPYNTCSSFASIAGLESSLRKAGLYTDMSEWHLAYFIYNPINGIPSFTKRSTLFPGGTDTTFDQGSNYYHAIAIWTRGPGAGGPVSAASAPYSGPLPTGNEESIATIQRAYYIGYPTETDTATDHVKGLLQENGAVLIAINANYFSFPSNFYYNFSTSAFRNTRTGSNHAVCIVGWDDNYPKENFPAGNQPPSDGAWIVRNSWGKNWHDNGYFYMSYDSIIDEIASIVATPGVDAKTYQYDMHGKNDDYRGHLSTGILWVSNIFTADANHLIKAVSVYHDGAVPYELYIRKGVGSSPASGTLALGPQTGSLGGPGYHRIDLDRPISVSVGERFAVIVKLTYPAPGYSKFGVSCARANETEDAIAKPGVGWYSTNGSTWSDVTKYLDDADTVSLCLKAFADIDTKVPVTSVSFNKTSTTLLVGSKEPLTATVSPNDAAYKKINWSSSNTAVATISAYGIVSAVAAGTATITAISAADSTKFATCTVTVVMASIGFTDIPKALFAGNNTTLQAGVVGIEDNEITWQASHGTISSKTSTSANYNAPNDIPSGDGKVTIIATNARYPSLTAKQKILIRSLNWTKFDGNSKTTPQLLDLANAFGSTLKVNLDKYDLNGDGVIDNEDFAMLFEIMGW
ncbi:MAG: lectin like domain-containing protein [Holophagales bacterium]|jgi:C1A family cysteine protease|nr:lectin like domain-containing protein [Holophagales bacterium]